MNNGLLIVWTLLVHTGSFVRRSAEECAKAKEEYYLEKYIDLLLGTNTATKKPKPLRGRARKPSVKFRTKEIKKKLFSDCPCGLVPGASTSNRIIGGEIAEPHSYPWLVRIYGGCPAQFCTGALISDRHVLTAFHCLSTFDTKDPCDHSDGKRLAAVGIDYFEMKQSWKRLGGIPLKKFYYPPNPGLDREDPKTHDLAIYELETPVKFSKNIQPICLPKNGYKNYTGLLAVTAGWGDFRAGRNPNSEILREVELEIAPPIGFPSLFSTITEKNDYGVYKDPCSGDSGAPLMLKNENNQYRIIGTVNGGGYHCDENTLQLLLKI
ncbi:transmembrane protease serine 9 isoform X2 [Eurytemora carolleeae]|uniref:transmembrane protease serine 9 isoform X2 n=1 Tax=Eurytemora carolleeae TaxID=1294199 RepID=UPI000C78F7F7|nr:transmembrane protease serine 9 isoform X2 [Eurytemora carolleeae]|eukprot:XP_023324328.1 transmembrane protease serine 9-like isoform X2 [Eurytemora affinis]